MTSLSRVIRSPNVWPPAVLVGLDRSGASAEAGTPGAAKSETSNEARPADPRDVLEQAQAQADELVEADRRAAREQGYREGLEAAKREMAEDAQRLAALIDSAVAEHAAALRQSHAELLELCLAVSEKIARKALSADAEALANVVQEALERAAEGTSVTVRLNPEDEALLEPYWKRVLSARGAGRVAVVKQADESIECGGCVVEAGGGHVDATLAARIDSVRAALTEDS